MKSITLFSLLAFSALFLNSCNDEDPIAEIKTTGVYITSDGNFTDQNGDVDFFNLETTLMTKSYYSSVNGRFPGSIVNSLVFRDSNCFISINGKNIVEVVNASNFITKKQIGVNLPYGITDGGKKIWVISVKDVMEGSIPAEVYGINPNSLTITDTIKAGGIPNYMAYHNGKLYIANGSWGKDQSITIADVETKQTETITNLPDAPTNLVVDINNHIWVLCAGKADYNNWPNTTYTPSHLIRINGSTKQVDKTFEIGSTSDSFSPLNICLSADKRTLYFAEADGVYKMSIDDSSTPSNPFIAKESISGLSISPSNGDVYVLQNTGYTTAGTLTIYQSSGVEKGSYPTGIAPNGVFFR